jgi:hypothetical protein
MRFEARTQEHLDASEPRWSNGCAITGYGFDMTPGRRLLGGLVAAAAFLLIGRAFALVYSDYAWYSALE